MGTFSNAVQEAAGSFQRISDESSGERRRRASAVALVLRVVECAMDGCEDAAFLARRAAREVEALPRGGERSALRRLLAGAESTAAGLIEQGITSSLVALGYELERTHRLPEADAALLLTRVLAPECPEVALHAGRVARKLGESERAAMLYVLARELDGGPGGLGRLAAVGEAAVSGDAERALGRAIRSAVRAGDGEAAAVGLEERARARRCAGRRDAAIRDLCMAAVRFVDPVDRARVAHELADIAVAGGDIRTTREALLLALACGDVPQRDHAQSRLHTLCRGEGDQLGMRRWRSYGRPALVSLSPMMRHTAKPSPAATVLARLRDGIALTPAPAS